MNFQKNFQNRNEKKKVAIAYHQPGRCVGRTKTAPLFLANPFALGGSLEHYFSGAPFILAFFAIRGRSSSCGVRT